MNVLQEEKWASQAWLELWAPVGGKESLPGAKEGVGKQEGGQASWLRLGGEIREEPVQQECCREILSAEEPNASPVTAHALSKHQTYFLILT